MNARGLLVLIGVLACATPASSAVNGWTGTGPEGGDIAGIHYVNGNGAALAVTFQSIYRTTDNGVSWTRVLSTLGAGDPLIAVNPANGNQVLAALDTLYRSTDGGVTWNAVSGLPTGMYTSQSHPTSMAFTRDGSAAWLGTEGTIAFRSTDAGASWTARSNGISTASLNYAIAQLEVDAVDANIVYAVTHNYLYRTLDGGANWSAISDPNDYRFLAASHVTSGSLLASRLSDGALVRSGGFGATFNPVGPPGNYHAYYGPGSRVYSMASNSEFKLSIDDGSGWTPRAAAIHCPIPRDLAIDPSDPDRLLVACNTGIFASIDGGINWTARSSGINELNFLDAFTRTGAVNALFVTAGDQDLVYQRDLSTDAWTGIANGTIPLLGTIGGLDMSFAVAPSDGTLYLARPSAFGASIDAGAHWDRRADLDAVGKLTVDPNNPLVVYATDQFIRTAKSIDGGMTWTSLGAGLPTAITGFAVNPANSNTVYALQARNNTSGPSPLYVSTNAGASWAPLPWSFSTLYQSNVLTLEPGKPSTIYIGQNEGLFKSTDSGQTWTALTPYPQAKFGEEIWSIVIDPQSPNILYVSTSLTYGPVRSVDRGATWELLRPAASAGSPFIYKVALVPGSHSKLIGIGGYGGMFEMEVAPDLRLSGDSGAMTANSAGTATLTVTNDGVYSATAVHLAATLPAATGAYTAQGTGGAVCTVTGTAMACDIPVLAPAGTATASVSFTPSAVANWTASVSAYEDDSSTANNSAALTVQAAGAALPPPPPPPAGGSGGSSSGGGGGGRIDYLLLAALASILVGRQRFARVELALRRSR
jgi:hypothetical protein